MKNRKTTPKKQVGRPEGNHNLRKRLLDTAMLMFSAQGSEAVTIAMIAKECHTTNAMVHYYFGNKEQLLVTVAEEYVLPAINYILDAVEDKTAPLEMIKAIQERVIEASLERPWLLPLWKRNIIFQEGKLFEIILARFPRVKVGRLVKALADGQQKGEINPGLTPELIFTSVMGATLVAFISVPGLTDHIDHEKRVEHTKSFMLKGLKYD